MRIGPWREKYLTDQRSSKSRKASDNLSEAFNVMRSMYANGEFGPAIVFRLPFAIPSPHAAELPSQAPGIAIGLIPAVHV